MNTQYKLDLDRYNKEFEQVRAELAEEIKQLTLTLEEQRSTYEFKINELE